MATADRAALIRDLERRHITPTFPRGQLTLIVAGAGIAGFLGSAALLRGGVDAMWLRYPLAVVAGYLAFLGLLRLWIAVHGSDWRGSADLPTTSGPSNNADAVSAVQSVARGGRSGGGGGGARWDGDANHIVSSARGARHASGGSSWGGIDLDLDEGIWLVIAGALVCGGAVAVGYVIYIAPALLAEVTLDAALVTAVYKRLRPHDVQHWSLGVVRRTWLPALILALCLAGAGYALHRVAPEARSIGGVIAHLRA